MVSNNSVTPCIDYIKLKTKLLIPLVFILVECIVYFKAVIDKINLILDILDQIDK